MPVQGYTNRWLGMISGLFRLLKHYMRLGIFAFGLLVGVQVPAFVDQYSKRVDAHLLEATQNLSGFQFTADRYFSGSIEALIAHYAASNDPVFQQDALSIRAIYTRVLALQKESGRLAQDSLHRAWHVFSRPTSTLFDETRQVYSYTVPLNPLALIWGAGFALIIALLFDGCMGCVGYCVHHLRKPNNHFANR